MLSAIYNGISRIVEFFDMLIDIVVDLFTGLVDFMKTLAQLPLFISSTFSNSGLPAPLIAGIVSIVAVVIILRIIDRD